METPPKNNKKWLKVASLIILLSILAGVYFFVSKNIQSLHFGDETQNALTYSNSEYGFSFVYDEGYRGLWHAKKNVQSNENEPRVMFDFYLDDFHQFSIHVFDVLWWRANAEILDDDSAWLTGKRGLPNLLGIYLDQNSAYIFTLRPNNQSCPDLNMQGGGPLCQLVKEDEKMIQESFKTWNL